MDFMLLDSSGNAVDAFDTDAAAVHAFVALINHDPALARNIALIAFDDDGIAVGDPLIAADLMPDAVITAMVDGASWTKLRDAAGATFISWVGSVTTLTALPENGAMVPAPAPQVA
jgi:hypothetical protein